MARVLGGWAPHKEGVTAALFAAGPLVDNMGIGSERSVGMPPAAALWWFSGWMQGRLLLRLAFLVTTSPKTSVLLRQVLCLSQYSPCVYTRAGQRSMFSVLLSYLPPL